MKRFNSLLCVFLCVLSGVGCAGVQKRGSSGPDSGDTLKIVSFNIRNSYSNDGDNCWDNRREAVVRFLESEQPDAVGLQEACPKQLSYLKEKLPFYIQFGCGRGDKPHEEFMTILYNSNSFDLLDGGNFWMSATPDTFSMGWDAACPRITTWVKLQNRGNGSAFYYFNTHLDHVGSVARTESLKLLAIRIREIAGDSSSVVLGGDMNVGISHPAFEYVRAFMTDGRAVLMGGDVSATWQDYGKAMDYEAIDHFFYRNLNGVSMKRITDGYGARFLSDHYPMALIVTGSGW